MRVIHHVLTIETDPRPECYDITDEVRGVLADSALQDGILLVYSPHTTCSVLIQEDSVDTTFNGTKFIMQDLFDVFDRVVPRCVKEGQYLHPGPKCAEHCVNNLDEPLPFTLNTDAHLRSVIMGRSETIPVVGGQLQLGEHGTVYFADFDGTRPRDRTVQIQIIGQ